MQGLVIYGFLVVFGGYHQVSLPIMNTDSERASEHDTGGHWRQASTHSLLFA